MRCVGLGEALAVYGKLVDSRCCNNPIHNIPDRVREVIH